MRTVKPHVRSEFLPFIGEAGTESTLWKNEFLREMDTDRNMDTDTDISRRHLRELNYDFGQGKEGNLSINFQLLLTMMASYESRY